MENINPYLRSAVYKALADFYRYPDPQWLEDMICRKKEFSTLFEDLAHQTGFISEALSTTFSSSFDGFILEDTQVEYVRLFDYRPPCKIYESAHVKLKGDNPAQLYLLIEGCYEQFGLAMSETFKDPPDHLSIELEFMHFLAHKQASALQANDENEVEKYLKAQRDFSANHITQWVPGFCDCLTKKAGHEFYRQLGDVTGRFIDRDSAYLKDLFEDD